MPEPTDLAAPAAPPYWLYLLECEGGVYYAGIARDVERRFLQHLFGRGARFTRARPPLRILAAREYPSKRDALRAELALKALARGEKLRFFGQHICAAMLAERYFPDRTEGPGPPNNPQETPVATT
ncbi:GIY-YIG nuclease family protein [Ramlibacter alkalitolerans]|uniref:GIY-YIG nuclease family protein n=1 Tax=Ramlibacter alkalitolerans TaxID=2039631 RepID=A0ABS1JSJ8_9BURK|nr:GIY-YIG nuclease family protein [Ramlibacter alkalitolerans]MBL0426540.1 GIY-YIG nuclease family protein [Ramlibacter alkalitolerans]